MTRDNEKTNADGAWAAAGSSAWCALTETSPEAATPEDLALQATAVDDALCEAGVDARIAADGVRELRARAEKAEAALAMARRYAFRCLRASGDDRDDAVRDLDSYGFSTNAGQEILDEVATLRAQVDAYTARAAAEMLALRAREENAEAETETRLLHGEIEMLRSQVAKLREALRNLLDEQNGPPLHRRRVEWEWASDNAELSLANTAPNGGEK